MFKAKTRYQIKRIKYKNTNCSYWSWDPKETWALITWIVFASYIHARLTKNWQGQKAALLGALGFVVVWVCYLGVNFLGKGLHSYGWLS